MDGIFRLRWADWGFMIGLLLIGLPFMRTRKSTYIDGVGPDAEALSEHLVTRLSRATSGGTPSDARGAGFPT